MPFRAKILFLATEDWFFASHFLPMARAAREMGLEVVVVARVIKAQVTIEERIPMWRRRPAKP